MAQIQEPCTYPGHDAAVQELVIHIHQVFMQEGIVATHLPVQITGLVFRVVPTGHVRKRGICCLVGSARKNEYEAVFFTARISPYPLGHEFAVTNVGNIHAMTAGIIGPAMVTALHLFAAHVASRQRHLAVGATVFQRKDSAGFCPDNGDGFAGKRPGDGLSGFDVLAARQGIPVIGMCAGPAQVTGAGFRARGRNADICH